MRTGLKNTLCMAAATMSITGCTQLAGLAGSTAVTYMLAPPHQTYRLSLNGMTVPADQLAGLKFPESLLANVYVADVEGAEILKHLHGGRLNDGDSANVNAALRNSLNNAGLLSSDQTAARYQLKTAIIKHESRGTIDVMVKTQMQFILTDVVMDEILVNVLITTPTEVEFSEDQFLYIDRIGKAMEGSVRGNIRLLLERLTRVPIIQGQAKTPGPGLAAVFRSGPWRAWR